MTPSEADKEKRREYQRIWHQQNKERQNQRSREWARNNPERHAERSKAWEQANPEKRRRKQNASYHRRKADPAFKLRLNVSRAMRNALGRAKSCRSWEAIVGYSREELRLHLERQFLGGMSWSNYGEWHIDHIIPLSSFTITGPDDPELRRAWALPNLRPLWAVDNIRKSAKLETLL